MRSIIFERTWEVDLAQLRDGQAPPAPVDEVIEAVEFVLSSTAANYSVVGGTRLRVMNILAARGLPPLNVWFTVEEDTVVCHHLEPNIQQLEEDCS